MSGAFAVTKKELRSYFYSPVGYIALGIFLVIMGIIFAKFVAIYAQSQRDHFGASQNITLDKLVSYLCQNMAFILCFMTPFVTMRLFAEERRQSTLELLFTAPLSGFQLVMGKFFAGFLLMAAMVLASFVFFMLFFIAWGNPDLAVIGTTYFGMLLALACYISIGALISATTNSQAVAAVLTFIILITLWLTQSLAQGTTARLGFIEWGPVLTYLSPLGHFNSFAEGLIHIKDVVYFLSFTALMLFLTNRVVESNRWR